jgi:tight adherence protein B
MQSLAMFFLASVAVGGLFWVFAYPSLSGQKKAEQRMASVAKAEPVAARATRVTQKSRRDTVENTLKEIEQRHKNKNARRFRCASRKPACRGRSASSSLSPP